MPPLWLLGQDEIRVWMLQPGSQCRGSRLLPTAANGCAAFAQYRPDGRGGYYPWAMRVLETDGGLTTGLRVLWPGGRLASCLSGGHGRPCRGA